MKTKLANLALSLALVSICLLSAFAQTNAPAGGVDTADSARKLNNLVRGFQYNQPVIPLSAGTNWNFTSLSLFLSPKNPSRGDPIWGIGPDFNSPSATEGSPGPEKWGAGPTALVVWQKHSWAYGALANQIWSFGDHDDRQRLNSTVTQLIRIGQIPVNPQFDGRYYPDQPAGGPDWGLRLGVTFVFPK
jgi:hypothetical protein